MSILLTWPNSMKRCLSASSVCALTSLPRPFLTMMSAMVRAVPDEP
jgi:hypothetical protein